MIELKIGLKFQSFKIGSVSLYIHYRIAYLLICMLPNIRAGQLVCWIEMNLKILDHDVGIYTYKPFYDIVFEEVISKVSGHFNFKKSNCCAILSFCRVIIKVGLGMHVGSQTGSSTGIMVTGTRFCHLNWNLAVNPTQTH